MREVTIATLPELEAIVTAMPERLRPMVLLAAWCGLRFGELAGLTRADLDLKAATVTVRRAVVRLPGEFIAGDPKSAAGKRMVAIPPHLLDELDWHLDHHVLAPEDSPVFSRYDAGYGGYIPLYSLHKAFWPAREAAGRPDTCTSTISATPEPPSRPPPAPPSPTSWPASGTPPRPWPCATSTPSTDATSRSPPHCPASPRARSSPSTPAALPADSSAGPANQGHGPIAPVVATSAVEVEDWNRALTSFASCRALRTTSRLGRADGLSPVVLVAGMSANTPANCCPSPCAVPRPAKVDSEVPPESSVIPSGWFSDELPDAQTKGEL